MSPETLSLLDAIGEMLRLLKRQYRVLAGKSWASETGPFADVTISWHEHRRRWLGFLSINFLAYWCEGYGHWSLCAPAHVTS